MKYSHLDLANILARLPGEYKELFLESSQSIGLSITNGRVEPMSQAETTGVSLLQTAGKSRQFASRESLEELAGLIAQAEEFVAPVGALDWTPTDEILSFKERDILEDLSRMHGYVTVALPVVQAHSWITSYQVGIGLKSRSYITLSNKYPGGADEQYYDRLSVFVAGERDGVRQEYYETMNGDDSLHQYSEESVRALFESAVKSLGDLLLAPEAPSGEMDIVLSAESGGTIIHEAVGHGLEGDLQGSSAFAGKIGELVASPLVTLYDDPTIKGLRGSYRMDHEGHPAARALVIENGILKNYLHQTSSAEFLALPHNGHGRRETYAHESQVRMGNTYMDNGPSSPEEIIASVQNGIYITSVGGGQVDTTSGDFVFKTNFGYRIENGRITHPIRAANLAGNGPKMMRDISMIANDLVVGSRMQFSGGTCGKEGQGMPVTSANPTFKVRLKVTG